MYSATTIANFFIGLKSKNMTPMKVIKLTYISYGWYLALTNNTKRLIDESPQAWVYGPVFPSLYSNLKEYGKTEIKSEIPVSFKEEIEMEDKEFLKRIFEMYKKYDGIYLSALTHTKDSPWKKTYKPGCNNIIDDYIIFNHYKEKLI